VDAVYNKNGIFNKNVNYYKLVGVQFKIIYLYHSITHFCCIFNFYVNVHENSNRVY